MKRMKFAEYLDFVKDAHNNMSQQDIILMYEGTINQQIIKSFAYLTECRLEQANESVKMQRTVYHIMLESLQNIAKHGIVLSPEDSDDLKAGFSKSGILIVGMDSMGWFITTGNLISKKSLEGLTELIDKVNGMEHEELKKLKKETMLQTKISEKGGAGLGIIDMAKRTGNELLYNVEDVGEDYCFFILTVTITPSAFEKQNNS